MKNKKNKKNRKKRKTTTPFYDLYKRNKNKEKPKQFWAGIIQGSVGFIYGPSKSGKTILCENLAFAIVTGKKEFLGIPIEIPKSRILYISMEEDVDMRLILRGDNQYKGNSREEKRLIKDNLTYSDKDFIRVVEKEVDWIKLEKEIKEFENSLIFIDSTNQFDIDIENRKDANKMIQRFKDYAQKYHCAIVLIHHTTKIQQGKSMNINTMSGSSALSRKVEFFIGVNYLNNGTRYVKFVNNRYYQPPTDKCKVFSIQSNTLIKLESEDYESVLLGSEDGRVSSDNTDVVIEFINENIGNGDRFQMESLKPLYEGDDKQMARKTLYNQLDKLIEKGVIEKVSQGWYKRIEKEKEE